MAQADGTVIQINHYYPYGMTCTEDGTGDPKAQPCKYGGKVFDGECGLNLYDYLARSMDPAEGRFTSIDPLAEKFYSESPYVYCGNNPIRYIDPTGEFPIETIWDIGNVIYDVGAAVVNHINGDHKAARSHWGDVALDAGVI